MSQIPQETIQQVLNSTDIVDLINSYVPLRRAGTNFVGLCPFHNEKSPSFNVRPSTQSFYCFGCQKGGDAIAFIREFQNLPFTDAVRTLATRAGIPVIEVESDPHADQARRMRGRLLDVMRETTAYLHELLLTSPDAQHARDYLKSRGFGRDMAERWAIGWMPDNLRWFLDWARDRKFTGRELVGSGMAYLKEENDPRSGIRVRFRNRLMFPIRNEVGDVIGFSGRQLIEDKNSGKYVNSPETQLFKKSNVLFALDRAKKPILNEKAALLCEGQIDVISCHEHGIEQAIAAQGTAVTSQHARLLKRYTKAVVLCFDADNAGFNAAAKSFRELIIEGINVRVVELPKGDDPDSFLKAHGADAFRELIANARPFFDFKIDRATASGAMANAEQRAIIARECAELLAVMSDTAAREIQMNHLASRLQMGISSIKEVTVAELKKPRRQEHPTDHAALNPAAIPTSVDRTVAALCHLALTSPEVQHLLCEQYETLHEAGEFIAGIPLLERVLAARPDTTSPAAVNSFLAHLGEEDRLALNTILHVERPHPDPVTASYETMSMLAAKVLLQRDARNKALLADPRLPMERMTALLEEGKEIKRLLDGVKGRFITEDILPPAPKKPVAKKEWKKRGN
ncbi:DNA primase [Luteolibacter ambystomatis]|uniref:DNA primase n=1 Tax=Luteolibacter ambystomatis TaxID=2824561 RepID=UPI0036D795B2